MQTSGYFRTRYQSEADRWKELATERLARLELLNSQLEERHCHEVSAKPNKKVLLPLESVT